MPFFVNETLALKLSNCIGVQSGTTGNFWKKKREKEKKKRTF